MRKVVGLLGGLLFYSLQLLAQTRTITGKVSDESGNPLPNVSIILKGTSKGSTSRADGTYSLTVPEDAKTILISAVGLITQEIQLGASSVINTVLRSQTRSLSEVVVVAYGIQKRAALTGAVASVNAPDIDNKPFTSIDKILQGQIPGLQSVASTGQPGANQAILIRGMTSITASNGPLWVVDGMIINYGEISRLATTSNLLSTLNPNDIESVTVLKDAAAGSLYGSRAANGVILVTTKKGKAGKTRLRFDTEIGQNYMAYVNDRYKPLNADQYFELMREGLLNAGRTEDSASKVLKGLGYGNGIDFNWYDAIQNKGGKQQQYNLSAEGGNEKTTVYLSAGYFMQEGTTINSKLTRTSGSVRLTHKASDKLTLNFNINGGFVNQRAPATGGNFNNPVLAAYLQSPAATAYKEDGSYNFTNLGSIYNVIALTEMDRRFLREIGLRGNMNAEYKILENLKFRTSIGGDLNIVEEEQYNNPLHGDGVGLTGRSFYYYNRYFNRLWTNTLDYQQLLSKAWNMTLNFQLGYEAQKSLANQSSVQAQVLPATLSITWPGAGASPVTASALPSDYSFVSQFSTANININDKYIVSGSFRRDGSSKFGAKNKYGNFWSVGASWNMDKESFLKDLGQISQLKLRASYGVNGNSGIGNYDWYRLYSYGINYNALSGSAPSNVGDSNLTWELNRVFNVGADIGLLQNRIQLSVDVYNRRSEDLLLDVPLSLTTGYQRALRNVGSMQNAGIEIALHAMALKIKDFQWDVDLNYARNKNKILSMPGGNDILTSTFIIREGEGIQSYYLKEYAGVDETNGDPLWYVDNSHEKTTNNIDLAGRTIIGSALPKFFGSLTNTFRYKAFTLDVQLYYSFGNYVQDGWGRYYMGAGYQPAFNKSTRILNRWTKAGQVTDIPRYVYNGNKSFDGTSDFYLNKGDFIRVRNVQLSYMLPTSVLSRVKLSNALVYMRGTNLFTWVDDKNLPFDPEQGTNSTSNLNVFIPKTISVGLSLGF